MAAVKATIQESLLGTEKNPELSTQTKSTFDRHARQDEASEEAYMTEEDFVDAIAPTSENYVCSVAPRIYSSHVDLYSRVGSILTDSPLVYSTK